MPLLEHGALRDDPFTNVADDAALPDAPALVSLARLQRDGIAEGRNTPLGVVLPPDVSPEAIAASATAGAICIIRRGSKGLGIRYSGPKTRVAPA